MISVVVPFRRVSAKSRLPARVRARLAGAMLDDVLAVCREVGEPTLATAPGGVGAAVAEALPGLPPGPVLVVNADVPAVTPEDLLVLLAAVPPDGLALVAARDGTTNALALSGAGLFRPLYGAGSSYRFRLLARSRVVDVPNLVDDVDTLEDLRRLGPRAGPHTQAALAATSPELPPRRRASRRHGAVLLP